MTPIEQARADRQGALNRLVEFLRIPSVSTDPSHGADMRRAADWLAERLRGAGVDRVRVDETPGHPVVHAELLAAPGAATVLVYGHYDVQPPDPIALWESPPFEPSLRDGDAAYRAQRYDEAARIFTELSLERPDDADLLERLGAARYRAGDYNGAARAWEQVQALRDGLDSTYNAGNAWWQAGRLDEPRPSRKSITPWAGPTNPPPPAS